MSCPSCGQNGFDCSCSDTAIEVSALREMLEEKLNKLISLLSDALSQQEKKP